ncbi:MAG: phosphoheptose isomerase [Candidatus Nomurabacteria bacterium]|jgi:mannose-6-phosphate isomerase-like protein (cupin superfamily)|nr:phosphoheptose isomerase [Candidatus Nomurabacteria bacterium]
MSKVYDKFLLIDHKDMTRPQLAAAVVNAMVDAHYRFSEIEISKPWGLYFSIENSQADKFIKEFFPELDLSEVRMGDPDAMLTPKILLHLPGQRNSWQYHHRRAEMWHFLTGGAYHKSLTDKQGKEKTTKAGDIVKFAPRERHRLVGAPDSLTFVAEIWQHVHDTPSDEDDIVRVEDDFNRE